MPDHCSQFVPTQSARRYCAHFNPRSKERNRTSPPVPPRSVPPWKKQGFQHRCNHLCSMTALSADILFLSVRLCASSRKTPALPEGVTRRIRSRICRAHQALRVFFVRAAHRRACTTYFPMRASHFISRTTIEARFPPLPTLPCGGLPMQKVHQAHPPSGDGGYKKVVWLREMP